MTEEAYDSPEVSTYDFVITRIFDATRALVWKAWVDPEHRISWLGPHGFSGVSVHIDLRLGGTYRMQMRGPDGDDHWQQGVFREIVEPERLVMTFAWADQAGNRTRPETLLTVTFEELDSGKTKLTLRQSRFETVTARDAHHNGWSGSLTRLAERLERT